MPFGRFESKAVAECAVEQILFNKNGNKPAESAVQTLKFTLKAKFNVMKLAGSICRARCLQLWTLQ